MERRIIFIVLILLFTVSVVFGQTTGRLLGRVRDTQGNPIERASVILLDTDPARGIATDENGNFSLVGIPVGTYDVRAQILGYRPHTVSGVRINVNEATTQNFTLERAAVGIEGIVTTAINDLTNPERTGSARVLTLDAIENSPLDSIDGVLAIQAGAIQTGDGIHIRGGRTNEVVYTIDGMSVSDPVDGGSAMSIDMNAVADMVVMTGGFTAEYGNAQSGIINIVTHDGGSEYSGSVELISDHLVTDGSNSDELKVTFGGPVLGPAFPSLRNRLTFFFNAAGLWHDSRYRDYYISDPNENLVNLVGNFRRNDPYEDRNTFLGFDLDERNFNNYTANLKMTYRHNPRQTFSLAVRSDHSNWEPFAWNWKYALDHYAEVEENMSQYMFTYDHLFNPQTKMNIKGSYFSKERYEAPKGITRDDFHQKNPHYVYDADNYQSHRDGIIFLDENEDGIIDRPDFGFYDSSQWNYRVFGSESPRSIVGFRQPGSYYTQFIDDQTTTMTLRADFEYQLNVINNIKSGFEITRHEITKDRLFSPQNENILRFERYLQEHGVVEDIIYQFDPDDSTVVMDSLLVYSHDSRFEAFRETSGETDGYKATPWQGAFYLQDRLQFEGMIANVGLRFDFWYLGDDYLIKQDDGSFERTKWEEITDDDVKKLRVMVSPRVGVSHPISEKAVLHFAYNYQNQIPQMQYVFTTAKPIDAVLSQQSVDVGNPSLEPQITVTYEVGLQQQLADDYVLDITGYYKNIYNYVSLMEMIDPEDDNIKWYQYVSEDYGSARGVDLTLQRMLSNFIAGSVSYSFAWAQGNHSGLTRDDEFKNLREFPLNWDSRHSANLNFEFRIGRDEEWWIPFTDVVFPLDDLSFSLLYSIASGMPYTPVNQEGTQALDTNSRRMPYTENANLRITKNFRFGSKQSLRLYASINNIFNRRNINWVYPRTGEHDYDGEDLSESNSDYTYPEVAHNYLHFIQNPSALSTGRTYSFGVSYRW
jgi:outer membrane receptor protein involved in Fe transport